MKYFCLLSFLISTIAFGAKHHSLHGNHKHQHGPKCGHKAERHDDHVDYKHDGHLHHQHASHWHECSEVKAAKVHSSGHMVHEKHAHVHGKGCGHKATLHDGHIDYQHDGHTHHWHGGHWHEG